MFTTSKRVAAGMAAALILMPLAASAQTSDIQSQIQSLLSQIQALQQQLRTLVASSTPSGGGMGPWMMGSTTPMMPPGQVGKMACVTLNRNLGIGSRGDDVKKLQEMLGEDDGNGFDGAATGFFGPKTAQAMMRFQMRFGIASSTSGAVGPTTRGFFERRCGKGLDGEHGPWMMGSTTPPQDRHGDQGEGPRGMMPINGGQNTGRGLNGEGPQNW